jgi:hypothetical protein
MKHLDLFVVQIAKHAMLVNIKKLNTPTRSQPQLCRAKNAHRVMYPKNRSVQHVCPVRWEKSLWQ